MTERPPAPVRAGAAGHRAPTRLEVDSLRIRIGPAGPDVVSDISFAVQEGEMLGLVGESGSGKTTIALALLGHTRPGLRIASGRVLLDGTDLLALPPRELRSARGAKVSYVPQDPSSALSPALRIGTQLREVNRSHPDAVANPAARIAEVLSEAKLDPTAEFLRRYPHQLSGGQQQRVALAMAFICRPSLIVLDEPTTGLDVSTQRHILDTVRNLCGTYGVAAVYVSHDLAVVSGLVAQVAVMYAGKIIERGATEAFFRDPLHPYSRGLIGAVPSPDRAERLIGIRGQQPRPGRRGPGCSFAPRCDLAVDACTAEEPRLDWVGDSQVRCVRVHEARPESEPRPAGLIARANSASPPVMSVRDLAARYGTRQVLSGLSFDVPPDSCVAVVGESGAGKTTLAQCLAGLHDNWTGDVRLNNALLATQARRRPRDVLRRIQYVFQNPYSSLNPRKTVGQIVAQPLEEFTGLSFRERSEKTAAALTDTALGPHYMPRYPDQLSGGERQRVAIARALITEPDVLICDEITSSLDVSVQAVIVELLRRVQQERQLAMIFITHNLALVRSIAQSVIVLRDGAVVESGPAGQVLENPADPYARSLMQDVPKLLSS